LRLAEHRLPGLVVTDHAFDRPLVPEAPDGRTIEVFAREVVAPRQRHKALPWLVYLQGGPGGKAPRPANRSGWLGHALQDFRVLLLDQRGTGRSSPTSRHTLAALGSPEAQAEYLAHLRAPEIVADAEAIRRELAGDEPWTALGQSYGGFCALTYLSFAPEGLREVLVTGGLPSLDASAEHVYHATYPRVAAKTERFRERYPDDQAALDRIADLAADGRLVLPTGRRMTPERLAALGTAFGMSDGFERLHHLLDDAFEDAARDHVSDGFLQEVLVRTSFGSWPLYAVLQEAIYGRPGSPPSRWAAQRVRDTLPDFDPAARPLAPTGEMIYPWMFEQDPALAPLRAATELLHEKDDWSPLYDVDRLGRNEVPVAAAVYHDDMYVDYGLSMQTAGRVRGLRAWVTSEFEHDGLRSEVRVFDRLLAMVRGDA
jgi:pimeloyl-ACP methyl ester carboxylesterase